MTESFWQQKRFSKPVLHRESNIPQKCDIAIVGGGLIGIATAYYLQKIGCDDVVVLEKEYVGFGASGRNAGFLLAGLSEPYSRLRIGMGPESAKELMKATIENHNLIAKAISEKAIECEYERSGSYHLAVTEVEKKEYDNTVNQLNRDGFDAKSIDYPTKIPSGRLKGYRGGYYSPSDGRLDPFAFVSGLSKKIRVVEHFGVNRINKSGGVVEIIGLRGKVKTEMAVLAINGYSPLLDRFFEKLIFPVRGQMMATSPLKNNILGKEIYYTNFGYDYFTQPIDNRLLVGGLRNRYLKDEIGFADEINKALQNDLILYIEENLGIARFGIESRWSGLMGDTIDGLPIVGALPHNRSVIMCAGFNGHGFGLGMIVAKDLAKAILNGERSTILDRFSLNRFL